MLALEHKDLSFEKIGALLKREKVELFDNEIINKLENKHISFIEKSALLKKYIDTKKVSESKFEDYLLHYFSCQPNYKSTIFNLILKLGPDLNILTDSYLTTPLFRAHSISSIGGTYVEPMQLLIDAGADWRIINREGKTCFDCLKLSSNTHHYIQEVGALENYAKEHWKKLKRENTPIPAILFTVQNQQENRVSV
jgi:hypothetical protein